MDRFSQHYLKIYCAYFPYACSILRTHFQKKWKMLTNKEWEKTSPTQKSIITNSINEFYKQALYLKRITSLGNYIDEWNLKTFTRILQNVALIDISPDLKRRENNMITTLLALLVQVSCNPTYSLTDNEFQDIWKKMEDILLHFGAQSFDLRKLKATDFYSITKEAEMNENLISSRTATKVNNVKRSANKYYMDGEYVNAVKFYCEALDFENLSKVDRAVLYSNRSASALAATSMSPNTKALKFCFEIYGTLFPNSDVDKLVILYEVKKAAKNDAKKAVQLRPTWFRGHYRLACAYQSLLKHEDALRHFDIAIKLNPTIPEMNVARESCCKNVLHDSQSTQFLSCIHKLNKIIKEWEMSSIKSNTFWEMWSSSYPFDVPVINRLATKGSLTAQRLQAACKHYTKALIFFNSNDNDENKAKFVHELAKCVQIEPVTAHFTGNEKKLALDIVTKMLRRQDMNKLSELDKNIRICKAHLMIPESINLDFIDESAAKYPDEEYFQELYCIEFACFEENDEDALSQLELSLEVFPKNCKLLFTKADVLRRMYDCPKKSVESFKEFLKLAPVDDRFVPNVCYKIAFLLACQMFMFGHKDLFSEIKKYFSLGQEAEKIQLPFFPVQETLIKTSLRIIIQTLSHHIKEK